MRLILLIILILLVIGALPTWPYSTGWELSERWFGPSFVDRAADYLTSVIGTRVGL